MKWSHPQGLLISLFDNPYVRTIIADGTVRSGKTTIAVGAWLAWSGIHFRGHQFMVSAKTSGQIRDVLMPVMREVCSEAGVSYNYVFSRKIIEIGDNEYVIMDGLDRASASRLQGRTLAGALIDEAPLMPSDFLDEAFTRCSVPGAKLCLTCNPAGGPSHWFARRFFEGGATVVRSTMLDNPAIQPDYISDITENLHGTALKRRVLGNWAPAVGAVYPIYTLDAQPQGEANWKFVSIDHALASTTAALLWEVHGDKAWIVDEYVHHGYTQGMVDDSTLWQDIYVRFNVGVQPLHCVVVDPAALSLKAALKSARVTVVDAQNDVLPGIEHTNAHLAGGRLRINPGCVHLRGELDSYHWDPIASERGEDKVVKEKDHCVDAMRYGAVFLSGVWDQRSTIVVDAVPLRNRHSDWYSAMLEG